MVRKGLSVLLVVMYQVLLQPTTRRGGMTNSTGLRQQWSTAGFLDIALVRTTVTKYESTEYVCTTQQRIAVEKRKNMFRLEVAASARRSCQLQVLSGVPDSKRGQSCVIFFGEISPFSFPASGQTVSAFM